MANLKTKHCEKCSYQEEDGQHITGCGFCGCHSEKTECKHGCQSGNCGNCELENPAIKPIEKDWEEEFKFLMNGLFVPPRHAGDPPIKDWSHWHSKEGYEDIFDKIESFIRQTRQQAYAEGFEVGVNSWKTSREQLEKARLAGIKEEKERWLNQPANQHDEKIRLEERTRILKLQEIIIQNEREEARLEERKRIVEILKKSEEEVSMLLSDMVTGLRIEKGMNQKELAEHFGTTEKLIAKIEAAQFFEELIKEIQK